MQQHFIEREGGLSHPNPKVKPSLDPIRPAAVLFEPADAIGAGLMLIGEGCYSDDRHDPRTHG
jgi:hypothetical protein